MSRYVYWLVFALIFGAMPLSAAETSPYEVVWTTPSENVYGTMPLGNGEVALNAWIDPLGDLRFYIARIDSIDENGRILKVGAVRIRVGEASEKRTSDNFEQRLDTTKGVMEAAFGRDQDRVTMRLWVDAHRPVIVVEVTTAKPVTATVTAENWRTQRETLASIETGDLYKNSSFETVVEPDTVITGLTDAIGWYHRNIHSLPYERVAAIQGMDTFPRENPILHRTFGAVVSCERPKRLDDTTLQSTSGTTHRFEIVAHTQHPSTEKEWLTEAEQILSAAKKVSHTERQQKHEAWWNEFWNRSYIHITPAQNGTASRHDPIPRNSHPVVIGRDQGGASQFAGKIGRVAIHREQLAPEVIKSLATSEPTKSFKRADTFFETVAEKPMAIDDSSAWEFAGGLTVEAWIQPSKIGGYARIVDKITPGGSDGFLFDITPNGSLRWIAGSITQTTQPQLVAGEWCHVAIVVLQRGNATFFVNGTPLEPAQDNDSLSDEFVLTRGYALQRYVTACAGRGRYPIKFNGSLFTVPEKGAPGDADYRRWGTGYWYQNTRLPYLSMPAAGDWEMMQPFFQMYHDILPLCKYRTKKYLGHDGAYYPECIYFWGDVFPETYHWTPLWNERDDKLQASGWHKWEWVGGLETAWMMLEYYDYTEDATFLREKAIPFAQEILTFFDQHYAVNADGRLVMHPSQALETWWDCTNPMPEVAGLRAVIARLLSLPESLTSKEQREFWLALQRKIPELPATTSPDGKPALAPAERFAQKCNVENPELYAVFPFRQCAYELPNAALGVEALKHRSDRGAFGWRQDDIFMAYLGLTDDARDSLITRARNKHTASRFPVFWGPNYDWIPDQDHGGILTKGVQSLIMQCSGRQIDLLPAWPTDWNCHFKLHAPYRTIIEGRVEDGRLVEMTVTPKEREKDVRVLLPVK
ncbi:MAG: DUF5703 domain-containing protein [Thermoguttaceae bacterium]